MGQYTGGQEDLGQAGQGQGPCWFLPPACGASEQNRPSLAERPPWLLPKAGLQALSPGTKPRTVLLSPGEKRFGVVLSQGPWP